MTVDRPPGVRVTFACTLDPGSRTIDCAVIATEHFGGSTDGTVSRVVVDPAAAAAVLLTIRAVLERYEHGP